MKTGKITQGIYLAAALALTAVAFDRFGTTEGVQAQLARTPIALEPGKLGAVDGLQTAVSQTAAIVEGVVSDIRYEYSEENGPWTHVTLSRVRALSGEAPSQVELRQFGGPLPNGGLMVAAELPVFFLDKEYIVFLRNTEWNVSPVVSDLAFRMDKVDDAEVVVNSDGQPVTRIGADGIELGPTLFKELDRDGAAPRPIEGTLRTGAIKPLDRDGFYKSLISTLDAQGLRATGKFIEKPGGEFNWRGQKAVRSPLDPPADGSDSREPEADRSDKL